MIPDIDIDFASKDEALVGLKYIPASMTKNEEIVRHPSGVYFQDIPYDPITKLSTFDYHVAEDIGFFKVDFLNNSIYADIKNEEHLLEMMQEPDWDLFEYEEIVSQLNHIHSHFKIVEKIKPKSIEDLAIVIALIRPGKKHLLNKTKSEIISEIWEESEEYSFKKSHAIAFATSIIVQLNVLINDMYR